ncbi:MAG: hypothetical protein V8T53_00645 [Eubacteriales bacterium]
MTSCLTTDTEAVYIGSGAGLPMFMGIPGEGLKGVYSANEYLTRSNLMKAYRDDSGNADDEGRLGSRDRRRQRCDGRRAHRSEARSGKD